MGWVNISILTSGARVSRARADKQGAWTNQAARRLQIMHILTNVGNERGDIHQRLHVRCVVRHRSGIRDNDAAMRVATRIRGPLNVSNTLAVYSESDIGPRHGLAGAITGKPSFCSWSITVAQVEASANAPCTRSTVGFGPGFMVPSRAKTATAPAARSKASPIAMMAATAV